MNILFAICMCVYITCARGSVNGTLRFDRVLIVVLENQPLSAALATPAMAALIANGTLMSNYYAITHPSQPNYIALLAGDMMGVHSDSNANVKGNSLVDLMQAKGVSWKAYQEDYPTGGCITAANSADNLYRRKHNPFVSFDNVRNNPLWCSNIVHSDQFARDLSNNTIPQYSFYTPNMKNDGHDTGMEYAAEWLQNIFFPNVADPFVKLGNSLVIVTFDEGSSKDNRIFTLLVGDMIPKGYYDSTRYDHYSTLRAIEDNFQLGTLGRHDSTATPLAIAALAPGIPDDISSAGNMLVACSPPLLYIIMISALFTIYFPVFILN